MEENIRKFLMQGRKVYMGECMDAFIDERLMEFDNDAEAINFYADYEATAYAFYLDGDEVKRKMIYDPFASFDY